MIRSTTPMLSVDKPTLTHCLAMAPVLPACASLLHSIALGLGSLLVILGTSAIVALPSAVLSTRIRLISTALLAVALACSLMLFTQAFSYSLHQDIGRYLPLLALSAFAIVPAHTVEPLSARVTIQTAAGVGAGSMLVFALLGAVREVLAHGTLGAGIPLIGDFWHGAYLSSQPLLQLAGSPAGALIVLGFLLALRKYFARRQLRAAQHSQHLP